MKATSVRPDGHTVFGERRGVGVRTSATALLCYELTVVAVDPLDAVRNAGGWIYDRVRAGWKVNVVVPESCDVRPLEILGVGAYAAGRDTDELPVDPVALAVSAQLFDADRSVRREVLGALRGGVAEVTMWGPCAPADVGYRVEPVQYRLSPAARAFKAQALRAAGASESAAAAASVEQFHGCALWYPADGPDLTAVR